MLSIMNTMKLIAQNCEFKVWDSMIWKLWELFTKDDQLKIVGLYEEMIVNERGMEVDG